MILGKNMTILEKNSAILSNIGKIYLLNWDISANLGMFQVNWEFFQPIGKKFGTGNGYQLCIEKKPWCKVNHHIHHIFIVKWGRGGGLHGYTFFLQNSEWLQARLLCRWPVSFS